MELPSSTEAHRLSVQEFDTTKLLTHAAAQATERRYKEFLIVDIDSHHQESEHLADIYTYIDDPVIRQTALSFLKTMGRDLMPGRGGYQDMAGRITRSFLRRLEKTADRFAFVGSMSMRRAIDLFSIDQSPAGGR